MRTTLIALLFIAAIPQSGSAQEVPITIYAMTGLTKLPEGKWSVPRLWRIDQDRLTPIAGLGEHPVYGASNDALVLSSFVDETTKDARGREISKRKGMIRWWDLQSSELRSEVALDAMPCNMLVPMLWNDNRALHGLVVNGGSTPVVFLHGWKDRLVPIVPKDSKPGRFQQFTTVKDWPFAEIDVTTGKSWIAIDVPSGERVQGPFEIGERFGFVHAGKSAWFYNPKDRSLGPPCPLPADSNDYIPGMGVTAKRPDGEYLVTDRFFESLDEPRLLPKTPDNVHYRRPILAGDRPLWIFAKKLDPNATEFTLFDPQTSETLHTQRFDASVGNLNLRISPSGRNWFIHDRTTNKAVFIDTKTRTATNRDLSIVLKDFEKPEIVMRFKE